MKYKITLLLVTLFLTGCSFWEGEDRPLELSVNISAADNINLNADNLSAPVELRIYQLRDSEAFNQASFIDIYNDDQAMLQAAIISKRNLGSLLPDEKREITLPLNPETKYIAIIAAFSNYQNAKNKAILLIKPGVDTEVDVSIDGINASLRRSED